MNTEFAMARRLLLLLICFCVRSVQAQQPQKAAVVLPVQLLRFQRLTSREIWADAHERNNVQTSDRRFVGFSGERMDSTAFGKVYGRATPVLLYRTTRADSVWTAINLVLPDYASHEVRGPLQWENEGYRKIDIFRIDTVNLDHRGEAEVLVGVVMDCCGNTSHTEHFAVNIIDVNGAPKSLLSALIETRDVGYSSDSGFTTQYEMRNIKMTSELLVSRIKTNRYGQKSLLTLLKSGRYCYRDGHLVWVGK
ncbi:hypothetical protein [Hymenobacter negativus]|nr:hypothetical protein [Hymenobacter negativus]